MKSHLLHITLILLWLGGPVMLGYAALVMSSRCSREEEARDAEREGGQ